MTRARIEAIVAHYLGLHRLGRWEVVVGGRPGNNDLADIIVSDEVNKIADMRIRRDMTDADTCKTVSHEIGHLAFWRFEEALRTSALSEKEHDRLYRIFHTCLGRLTDTIYRECAKP